MTRFTSLFVVAGLGLGMLCFTGCESSDNGRRLGHDEQFGVGNGEFGTSTAIAGDYPNDVHHDHTPTTADASR